ncbi:SagB/ThcOx family dehydrogenase [Methanogenium organophilum]|uniref:SagB/ThcOx family dehydrogenase n=1 Tax=Methanogenium organophilum TaxID=2199 RepID=A0A9X9T7K9_METOG|nr:SagB/ThcOx family dehydrogenase [Methanogenium organophilum]WAI00506.1 SagB/ThcOx family dehydrogenase [Methanogenium organophilum]
MKKTGQEFLKKTQYPYLEPSGQMMGIPQPPVELPCPGNGEAIRLPAPASVTVPHIDLRDAILHRESRRSYRKEPITLDELSFLLWCTQGVKREVTGEYTFRTVPSAGARHAFETYVLVNNVEGVAPGLYRYLAIEHLLAEVSAEPGITNKIFHACLYQQFAKKNAVTIIWTAVPDRMTWRYSERGYRYLFLDAGHACQNLYLGAEAVGCGVCAIGAFDDEAMNQILGLDGETQFVIYIAAVGKITTRIT